MRMYVLAARLRLAAPEVPGEPPQAEKQELLRDFKKKFKKSGADKFCEGLMMRLNTEANM